MAILLLCDNCNNTLAISSLSKDPPDLEQTAAQHGWISMQAGWTCPNHDAERPLSRDVSRLPLESAIEHALKLGKSVRAKIARKNVNDETLLIELKRARRRIEVLLAEMQGPTRSKPSDSSSSRLHRHRAHEIPVCGQHF